MKNIISFFFPVADILERGITGLLLLIDGILYSFLSTLFKLFYALAEVQLLDSSVYEKIADRVYLFVGVIALFGISIGLLKALVNPDELNKGVIKSFKALITSIILLILMPTIFKYAYSFQHAVIADRVIEKIFQVDLGNNNNADSMFEMCSFDENDDTDSEMEGILGLIENLFNIIKNGIINVSPNECRTNYMIMNVMEAFITPASDSVTFEIEKIGPNEKGADWGTARRYMIYTGNFKYVVNYIDNIHSPESADQSISYTFILSTIAAGILIYVVLSFCIDLGVRTVKLAFYQVIAPIPVLMRMIPGKEGQFDKWLKATISTFIELFTRLIIISFIMFMIGNIFEIIDSMDGLNDVNLIGKAVIVIGLFTFAKQAPKLLSEALGFEGGNLSLKIKDKLTSPPIIGKGFNAGYNTANKFKGAATGALGGGWSGMVNGTGVRNGAKMGMLKGFDKGGNQFNSQRQGVYSVYGGKGKAGIFGKRAFLDDMIGNAEINAKNDYKNRFSNSKEYKDKMNEIVTQHNSEANKQKNDAIIAAQNNHSQAVSQYNSTNKSISDFRNSEEYKEQADSVFANERVQRMVDEGKIADTAAAREQALDKIYREEVDERLKALVETGQQASESIMEYAANLDKLKEQQEKINEAQAELTKAQSIQVDTIAANSQQAKELTNEYYRITKDTLSSNAEKYQKILKDEAFKVFKTSEDYKKQVAVQEQAFENLRKDGKFNNVSSGSSGSSSDKK